MYDWHMTSSTVHKLALPSVGAELFTYLKNVNDSEAFTASMRIKDALAAAIRIEVNSWFGVPALPELDQSLLRKLTNSLLAAGEAGSGRTLEALREVRFESTPMTQQLSRDEAAQKLRLATRDFRSAKGFLENNHKCINSFMKMNRAINDENIRELLKMSIRTQEDFLKWTRDLIDYWDQKTTVKAALRGSYIGIFQKFVFTFEEDISNKKFREILDIAIGNYVSLPVNQGLSNQNSEMDLLKSSTKSIEDASVEVHFHITEGDIEYEAIFHGYTKLQVSSIRIKLALLLQKKSEFANLKLVVSLGNGTSANTILVRTKTEMSEDQIFQLTKFLESEFLSPSEMKAE